MLPEEAEPLRLELYRDFAARYGVTDLNRLVALYDVNELMDFMPAHPNEAEKEAFHAVFGAETVSGYLDYQRSNNTFELIMQWQERTGRHDDTAIHFDTGTA